jgi:hypothetical protein
MRTGIWFLVAGLLLSTTTTSARSQGADGPNLPTGPVPFQGLAVVDVNGKLSLKTTAVTTSYVPRTVADPKGKSISYYEPVTSTGTRTIVTEQFKAYDVRGNPIPAKRLRKMLAEEMPVLVSANGKQVDSLHLRLYKDDVVILLVPAMIPQSAPPPVVCPPAGTPPIPYEVPAPPDGIAPKSPPPSIR